MKDFKKEIAGILLNSQSVTINTENPYTYASGIRSPIYCDNRILISNPSYRKIVVNGFCNAILDLQPAQIAGTATAGIPWAAWISNELNLPLVYVRSKPKEHGKEKQIEGQWVHDRTVVIEDLISTGQSSMNAVAALRSENIPVVGLIAIFSYGFESAENLFERNGVLVRTLTNLDQLLEEGTLQNRFSNDTRANVLRWRDNPSQWS